MGQRTYGRQFLGQTLNIARVARVVLRLGSLLCVVAHFICLPLRNSLAFSIFTQEQRFQNSLVSYATWDFCLSLSL